MIRKQAVKHPITFSILVIFIFEIVMTAASLLLALFGPRFLVNNGDYLLQGSVECFVALAGIGLVALFGYNHIWTEKKKGLFAGLGIGGYLIFVQVVAFFQCATELVQRYNDTGTLTMQPGWKIAVYIICFLLVGFAEEVFFRGLIANFLFDKHAKNPAGVWTATIWSGLLFGLLHITNVLAADPSSALVQVIIVTAMGMTFTAVYYRTKNIWVVILLHAFNNIWAGFSTGFFEGASLADSLSSYSPANVIGAIPYIIVTIVLLRPKKLREVIDKEDNEELSIEQRIALYSKSKKSRSIAITVTVAICIVLFAASIILGGWINMSMFVSSDEILDYSISETWNGEDHFSETIEFTADKTDDYDLTIRSYPGDSKVYMTLIIVDSNGNEVFNKTYGGRCSEETSLVLNQGEDYVAAVSYDFSEVADDSEVNYILILEIED